MRYLIIAIVLIAIVTVGLILLRTGEEIVIAYKERQTEILEVLK